MLLHRTILICDASLLIVIVFSLTIAPATRCAQFSLASRTDSQVSDESEQCVSHPVLTKNHTSLYPSLLGSVETPYEHSITICHRLTWSHFAFWKNMYLIIFPAICCFLLILLTFCEILDLDLYKGRVQATSMIFFTIFTLIYTIFVIWYEQNRVQNDWPIKSHFLGVSDVPAEITPPMTWQYSLLMCILSAGFKVLRILIQHYFGDLKINVSENTQTTSSSGTFTA